MTQKRNASRVFKARATQQSKKKTSSTTGEVTNGNEGPSQEKNVPEKQVSVEKQPERATPARPVDHQKRSSGNSFHQTKLLSREKGTSSTHKNSSAEVPNKPQRSETNQERNISRGRSNARERPEEFSNPVATKNGTGHDENSVVHGCSSKQDNYLDCQQRENIRSTSATTTTALGIQCANGASPRPDAGSTEPHPVPYPSNMANAEPSSRTGKEVLPRSTSTNESSLNIHTEHIRNLDTQLNGRLTRVEKDMTELRTEV